MGDLPNAMSAAELTDKLGLNQLRGRKWYIQATCATQGNGLYEGLLVVSRIGQELSISLMNEMKSGGRKLLKFFSEVEGILQTFLQNYTLLFKIIFISCSVFFFMKHVSFVCLMYLYE